MPRAASPPSHPARNPALKRRRRRWCRRPRPDPPGTDRICPPARPSAPAAPRVITTHPHMLARAARARARHRPPGHRRRPRPGSRTARRPRRGPRRADAATTTRAAPRVERDRHPAAAGERPRARGPRPRTRAGAGRRPSRRPPRAGAQPRVVRVGRAPVRDEAPVPVEVERHRDARERPVLDLEEVGGQPLDVELVADHPAPHVVADRRDVRDAQPDAVRGGRRVERRAGAHAEPAGLDVVAERRPLVQPGEHHVDRRAARRPAGRTHALTARRPTQRGRR